MSQPRGTVLRMTTNPGPLPPTRVQARVPALGSARLRLRAFRTPVRGHAFAAGPPGSGVPHPGARARLEREPANPADPLAVAVWLENPTGPAWRIGYLARGVAARIAPRLDAGLALDARVDGWIAEPDGRWDRPVVLLLPEPTADPGPDAAQLAPTNPISVAPSGLAGTDTAGAVRSPGVWGRPPGVSRRTLGRADRRGRGG
jgi:hypothetical protein